MPDDHTAARAWLAEFIERNGIKYEELSQSQKFLLMREIPCSIRCWRVGVSIPTRPGQPCDECGKVEPLKTSWEIIPLPV
jgi:hypothetical protein